VKLSGQMTSFTCLLSCKNTQTHVDDVLTVVMFINLSNSKTRDCFSRPTRGCL